ncbi:transglutaminase TgpA family protein [Halobacterium zhouii]|uniref:transglutaminase TgpA family protein n=1 Tax=Halobacterium zhouii TaxID=2902624 RepID=UPI001E5547C8|nr:transglutaminaseTgpA domain-containing protein [Halobacterium zhouii]
MSGTVGHRLGAGVRDALIRGRDSVSGRDVAAGAFVAVVVGAYLSVLYEVVTVIGGPTPLVAEVAAVVVLAAVFRALPWKYATVLAGVLLVGGLAAYLTTVPPAYLDALTPMRVVKDGVALLTGYSVMRMPAAGTWALAVAPAPTFLAAYLVFRRQYAAAASVAALTLGFFVLTGDSTTTTTLVGVLAAAGAVGFGTLAGHEASRRQVEVLAAVLAVMVVASAGVTAVPGGRSPLVPASASTASGSLVSADGYVGVGGSIRLSPKVHFVVESDAASYWRAGVYDRFTGDGWVRTSGVGTAENTPPPTGRHVTQRVTAKRTLNLLPAAAVVQSVDGVEATVTGGGLLQSQATLHSGDSYVVRSRGPVSDPETLASETGTAPAEIRGRYLQTPSSTSSRVVELASRITNGSTSNYAKAAAIERWLEGNKEYSLDARNGQGNLVNEFILEYEAGYCTYYASSMAVMLRTQGVPTRFVVGYTPGQRVSEDTWVVRGVDSHAWVEVYVPDRGWVRFDPTPGGERASTENQRVTSARQSGVPGVDAAGSQNGTWTPPAPTLPSPSENNTSQQGAQTSTGPPLDKKAYGVQHIGNETANVSGATPPQVGGAGGESAGGMSLPPVTTLVVWGVMLVGLTAGVRYVGLSGRVYRSLWLRWLPRGDPDEEVEGAFERVEYVLEKRHRKRRAGETVREYLRDVGSDERAERVAALRERSRYAGGVSGEDAAEAKRLARSLASEYSRLPGLRRGDSV